MEKYDYLFKKSEREETIQKDLDRLESEYKETETYKEYKKKRDLLCDEQYKAMIKRLESGRPKRVPVPHEKIEDVIKKSKENTERKKREIPENIKEFAEKFNNLSTSEKRMFYYLIDKEVHWKEEEKKLENPKTTEKDLNNLHYLLVQTVIDFINDCGLDDIDEVHFSADSLQVSSKYGEWSPSTDSYLELNGYEKKDPENTWTWEKRLIGKSY